MKIKRQANPVEKGILARYVILFKVLVSQKKEKASFETFYSVTNRIYYQISWLSKKGRTKNGRFLKMIDHIQTLNTKPITL